MLPGDGASVRASLSGALPLLAGMVLIALNQGMQWTVLGVRAEMEGFATGATGLVMSAFALGYAAGSVGVPRLVDRVGHVRVFGALASVASVAALAYALSVSPVWWSLMRALTGVCLAGIYVVAESWLNDAASNRTRARLLGVYVLLVLGGMAAGPLLINVADPGGVMLFVLMSVLVSLAVVPILLSTRPAPEIRAPAPVGMATLLRETPVGVFGCVVTGLSNTALLGMLAVYGSRTGLSPAQVSVLPAAAMLGGMALQWPLGGLADRLDRRRVLAGVTFAAAAVAALVPLGAGSLPLLAASLFVLGGLIFPLYSLSLAHANDRLDRSQMVAASGTLVLVTGLGGIAGPALAAGAMAAVGDAGLFAFLALAHGGFGVYVLWRMLCRPGPPAIEQGPAVYAADTSAVSAAAAVESAWQEHAAGEADATALESTRGFKEKDC